MNTAQNGWVSTFAAVRRAKLLGRNTHNALDDENRNKSLFWLITMNVCIHSEKIGKKISNIKKSSTSIASKYGKYAYAN